jgi:hypothetical protein
VHTLRKIASTIIALILLAAASDVIIFHRADTAKLLSHAGGAIIHRRFFEPAIVPLTALALLGLLTGFAVPGSSRAASTAACVKERNSGLGATVSVMAYFVKDEDRAVKRKVRSPSLRVNLPISR